MKKTFFMLFLLLYFYTGIVYAQSIVSQTINTAGLSGSNSSGSLMFAVGEVYIPPTGANQIGSGFISVLTNDILVPTALENEEIAKYFVIYPNPTPDMLHIRTQNTISYQAIVTDTQGKTYQVATFDNEGMLNLKNLAQGTYFLKIQTQKGQKTFKIIKN